MFWSLEVLAEGQTGEARTGRAAGAGWPRSRRGGWKWSASAGISLLHRSPVLVRRKARGGSCPQLREVRGHLLEAQSPPSPGRAWASRALTLDGFVVVGLARPLAPLRSCHCARCKNLFASSECEAYFA